MTALQDDYILRLTYEGGSVWFKGTSGTMKKYPGVKGYTSSRTAERAVVRILQTTRFVKSVEVIRRFYEVMTV